jgi:hypothetical protein
LGYHLAVEFPQGPSGFFYLFVHFPTLIVEGKPSRMQKRRRKFEYFSNFSHCSGCGAIELLSQLGIVGQGFSPFPKNVDILKGKEANGFLKEEALFGVCLHEVELEGGADNFQGDAGNSSPCSHIDDSSLQGQILEGENREAIEYAADKDFFLTFETGEVVGLISTMETTDKVQNLLFLPLLHDNAEAFQSFLKNRPQSVHRLSTASFFYLFKKTIEQPVKMRFEKSAFLSLFLWG